MSASAAAAGHKVYAIVNYDRFSILPELLDAYSAMVQDLTDRFYSGVTRYTTSGFLRMKLGEALHRRQLAPHIYKIRGGGARASGRTGAWVTDQAWPDLCNVRRGRTKPSSSAAASGWDGWLGDIGVSAAFRPVCRSTARTVAARNSALNAGANDPTAPQPARRQSGSGGRTRKV